MLKSVKMTDDLFVLATSCSRKNLNFKRITEVSTDEPSEIKLIIQEIMWAKVSNSTY